MTKPTNDGQDDGNTVLTEDTAYAETAAPRPAQLTAESVPLPAPAPARPAQRLAEPVPLPGPAAPSHAKAFDELDEEIVISSVPVETPRSHGIPPPHDLESAPTQPPRSHGLPPPLPHATHTPPPLPHAKPAGATPLPLVDVAAQATPQPKSSHSSGSLAKVKEITNPHAEVVLPDTGARIHHYEVIRLIGRGGMGSVYLGRDTRLGRRVAIKFLVTQSADLTKRFILEARTTAACSHENIVVIYEVDAWQGAPFMVFEYLEGRTLTKLMSEGKAMPAPRAVELMVPVVRALAAAHSQGVVHRDLKPDNVIVTDSGTIKVLDFGIAKVLQGEDASREAAVVQRPRAPKLGDIDSAEDDTKELTRQGAMMGTLAYMAPEQWGIGVPIDHRADIWAAGIMLFKMLAGKHPLDPLRGQQLMVTGMLDEKMPLLRSVAPDVPKELAEAVDKCLMKRKEQRWPDASSLLRALEPFLPGRYSSRDLKAVEAPYAGLSSFQESDAARFFGRSQEIAAMVHKVRERPLVGVIGPSGAGKSSFVRAGLVPALKGSGESWEAMVLRPGKAPLAALTSIISPLVSTSASVGEELKEQGRLSQKLAAEPGFVGAVLRARARREKRNILLFIDQFEELYTLVPDAKERLAFTAILAAVADDATSPIRVVLSLRSDFLDRVPEDKRFMGELNQGLFFLTVPGREGLREAIVSPAELAGYKFESPAIVDDMLNHLASTPGALPLLQFCASKLWESRDAAKKQLTRAAYDGLGGIAGALASHADAVLGKLPPASQPVVRAIFLRLVTPDRTRALVSIDEVRELSKNPMEVQLLVDELVQARLLVVQTASGAATIELVHESLIHGWPTLKRWLEETGEDAAFLEQLRTAARQWQQKGHSDDLLWRGELADEAARFQRRFRGALSEGQKRFLEAVVNEAQRAVRRRRTLGVVAVAGLSLLLAASAVALVVIQGARHEAQEQAAAAQVAEAQARQNLEEAQEKEKERAKAQAEAEQAAAQLRANQAELVKKQQQLMDALNNAEKAAEEARFAETRAVRNAKEAQAAKSHAEEARLHADQMRKEVQSLLAREQDRAAKLEEQLGSPVIDTLK